MSLINLLQDMPPEGCPCLAATNSSSSWTSEVAPMTALAKRGHDNTNLHDTTNCHSELHASGSYCNALCLCLKGCRYMLHVHRMVIHADIKRMYQAVTL